MPRRLLWPDGRLRDRSRRVGHDHDDRYRCLQQVASPSESDCVSVQTGGSEDGQNIGRSVRNWSPLLAGDRQDGPAPLLSRVVRTVGRPSPVRSDWMSGADFELARLWREFGALLHTRGAGVLIGRTREEREDNASNSKHRRSRRAPATREVGN